LLKPLCLEDNFYLNSVSLVGSGKNLVVRVVVDTDAGITLNECQTLSKKISGIFYRKEIFPGGYSLEVTSPGLSKPLEHDFEYKRNIGKELKVNYKEEEDIKTVIGELLTFDDVSIRLKLDDGELVIPRNDIKKAKIKLKW
jgi:ribosome maturation factor RimP